MVELKVCSNLHKAMISRRLEDGSLTEEECISTYSPKLQAVKDVEAQTQAFNEFQKESDDLVAEMKAMHAGSSSSPAEVLMAYAAEISRCRDAIAASEES